FYIERRSLAQRLTLLKQQIPDKPTWLLSSGCSRFVRLCSFDFLYPVRGTTSKPRCGDSFPRCNVKNSAFAALSTVPAVIPTLHRALYASGTLVHVSNIYAYAKVKQILKLASRCIIWKITNVCKISGIQRYKKNTLLSDLCYCNNKKFDRNNAKQPVEYKWSLWQRVASSENETSESSKDNFSTSKPVDMFDSNLSQFRGVDRPSPFFLSSQTLPTVEVANHDEIAFPTEKFCRSWQLSRRIWFTIVFCHVINVVTIKLFVNNKVQTNVTANKRGAADVRDDSSTNRRSLSSTFRSSLAPEVSPKVRFTTENEFSRGRPDRPPMVHPPSQTVTANEGESLDIIVEFCARPSYTKVLWISEKHVYTPDAPSRDGVRALAIEDGGTESCYRTTLRFETIQSSHTGEWLLLVRSSEGIADASVLLNVTRASGYSHANIRSASITYLLLCLILQAILREYRR
ncbi:hypothetical protein ALC62_07758, partial [Cyphomyrmex costatus]